MNNPGWIIQIDHLGIIKDVLYNSVDDIKLVVTKPLLQYIDETSHRTYAESLKETNMNNTILGLPINIRTKQEIRQILLSFVHIGNKLFAIGVDKKSSTIRIIEDITSIANEQANTIRSHYTSTFSNNENDQVKLFEELTALNNELINTKRNLQQKNNEIEALYEKQRRLSLIDFLTEIPNRRKFFKDIYTYVKIEPYTLTMMDFNNFKVVNDQFGHKIGDELLVTFTKTVKNTFTNQQTTLYRLGGDEFAILSPKATSYIIEDYENEIDNALQQYHTSVTIAYGRVIIDDSTVNDTNKAEEKMHEADQLMYQCKQSKKSKSD